MNLKIKEKDKKEIIKLYKDGKGSTEISKIYDCCTATICKIIKKEGITRNNKECHLKYFEKDRVLVIKLYKKGLSSNQISKKLNMNSTTVLQIVRKEGIVKSKGSTLKYTINENYFDKLNQENSWLLGLIAADGCIDTKNSIHFGQSGSEGLKIMKYIIKILNYSGPIKAAFKRTNTFYFINITSSKLVKKLKTFNIVHRKTLIYEFPNQMKTFLFSFLRGYIDGDGCVCSYKDRGYDRLLINFLGTKKFIDVCSEMINIKFSKTKIKRCKNLWCLTWYDKNAVEFGKLIFKNELLFSHYKKIKFLNYLKKKEI